jgi:hypothetical protein
MMCETRWMLIGFIIIALVSLGFQYAQAYPENWRCSNTAECGWLAQFITCFPPTTWLCPDGADCWKCNGTSEYRICLPSATGQCEGEIGYPCGTLETDGECVWTGFPNFQCLCEGASGWDYCYLEECDN